MKKIFLFLTLISLFTVSLFAQVSVDPTQEFYSDAVNWYLKGYVDRLPQLKPYPVNVISDILTKVIEEGESHEQKKAESYYKAFFHKKWHVDLNSDYYCRIYSLMDVENKNVDRFDDTYQFSNAVDFCSDLLFKDYLGAGVKLGLEGQSSYVEDYQVLPEFVLNSDLSGIEPHSFQLGDLAFFVRGSGNVTFGNEVLYGSLGFNSLGYGLFPQDDLILSPYSKQMLNGTFCYEGKGFQYSQVFGAIAAQSYRKATAEDYSAGKFFAFHSVNVPMFKGKINFSYFEGSVYGKHFAPSTLIPIPWIIVSLADGNSETVYAGGKIEYKPVPCFSWNTELLLNDLKLKKLLKLHLNDAAIRGAFKTGFVYAPFDSIASLISLDYTIVTPYTFAENDMGDYKYNYRDYTNFGAPIGTDLMPNSDRVSLKINFKPLENLKISTTSTYSRHGNQYEDLDYKDLILLDGTTFTDGTVRTNQLGIEGTKEQTGFLTQDDLMYTMQTSFDVEYKFNSKKKDASVSVNLGYTFEFIKNDGVDESIYCGNYSGLALDSYSAFYKAVKVLDEEKALWQAKLHDSYNHYFRAGVKISF